MRRSRVLQVGCLVAGTVFVNNVAFAQFPLPKLPGSSKRKDDSSARRKGGEGSSTTAQGVPIPADSPIFQAFERLEQQKVYHQRMTLSVSDPMMEQMMAQAGMTPAETITTSDAKQVSMHLKLPVHGQPTDFELRSVLSNGRMAKKWISPASERILAEADAQIASQLAQQETSLAKSIARNLSMGPMGLASSAVSAAGAAASAVAAGRVSKQAHDFFEWTCMDSGAAPSKRSEPPPLTDLRVLGDQPVDGTAATGYEFFVHQDGRFQGPLQMYVAKDSGLPLRIAMSDPRGGSGGGAMHMDYYGFNQGGDFEIPACLAPNK